MVEQDAMGLVLLSGYSHLEEAFAPRSCCFRSGAAALEATGARALSVVDHDAY